MQQKFPILRPFQMASVVKVLRGRLIFIYEFFVQGGEELKVNSSLR